MQSNESLSACRESIGHGASFLAKREVVISRDVLFGLERVCNGAVCVEGEGKSTIIESKDADTGDSKAVEKNNSKINCAEIENQFGVGVGELLSDGSGEDDNE